MSRNIWKVVLSLIAVPLAIGGLFFSLQEGGFFNLQDASVEFIGNEATKHPHFFAEGEADLKAKAEQFRGISLWKLDLKAISSELESFAWIENFQVVRSWPSSLKILVTPKPVRFLYIGGNGELIPIVGEGDWLHPVTAKNSPDVAILRGPQFAMNKELMKKTVDMIKDIPESGSFSRQGIAEIHHSKKDGYWLSLIDHGIKVKLGEDNFALKSARVSQVLDYVESRQIDVRVIDADLSKKVLVKLRKDP